MLLGSLGAILGLSWGCLGALMGLFWDSDVHMCLIAHDLEEVLGYRQKSHGREKCFYHHERFNYI